MELFKTDRARIRQFNNNDFQSLFEMMSDPLVMKFTGFREPQTEERIRELLDKWILEGVGELGVWAAEETEDSSFIGWFMLVKTVSDDPELGFMISKKKWAMGFATEISNGFLHYAAKSLNNKRVIASTVAENVASIKVLKKLGFKKFAKPKAGADILYFENIH